MLAIVNLYGNNLWLGFFVMAAVLPPVIALLRRNRWRMSLKAGLIVMALTGPVVLLLGDDFTRIDLALLRHFYAMIFRPLAWWLLCGLPTIAIFLISRYLTRLWMESLDLRDFVSGLAPANTENRWDPQIHNHR